MATPRTQTSTATGLQRGSAEHRDRVNRTIRDVTVWSGIGAVVASGAFVAFLVPGTPSNAAPATQPLRAHQDEDGGSQQSTTPSAGGGFASGNRGGYPPPVATSGGS
jgi:hypothetical protein